MSPAAEDRQDQHDVATPVPGTTPAAQTAGSASELAYTTIRDGILDGRYVAEEMLSEAVLAHEIGVSRTPVRAALARLQDEGWITIYPKRGALVRGLSPKAVADLADTRLVLESAGVQRMDAGRRATLAAELREAVAEQRHAMRRRDLRGFVELTVAFHRSFVEAGDNGVMLELNDRLADRQRFLLFSHGETLMARCAAIIAEHEELVDRLADDDAAGFAEILHHHLDETYSSGLRPYALPRHRVAEPPGGTGHGDGSRA